MKTEPLEVLVAGFGVFRIEGLVRECKGEQQHVKITVPDGRTFSAYGSRPAGQDGWEVFADDGSDFTGGKITLVEGLAFAMGYRLWEGDGPHPGWFDAVEAALSEY